VEIDLKVATILLGKANPSLESSRLKLRVDDGCSVNDLVEKLGIPGRLVGSVIVNGRRSRLDRVLEEGDLVALTPSISGG
jgi:sulfur carrier protein ThiS